jgi:hypothetical protein
MNALVEFDEKEFWMQLFSIVVRREARTEDADTGPHAGGDNCVQEEAEVDAAR